MSAPGPFTVVQRRPVDAVDAGHPEAPKDGWIVCREAFATLEQVRAAMRRIVTERLPFDTAEGIKAVIDARIANASFLKRPLTLPNGDVIKVEATTYHELWKQVPFGRRGGAFFDLEGSECVAAWNAEHGIGIGIEGGAR